jgi:hypothetical protein
MEPALIFAAEERQIPPKNAKSASHFVWRSSAFLAFFGKM